MEIGVSTKNKKKILYLLSFVSILFLCCCFVIVIAYNYLDLEYSIYLDRVFDPYRIKTITKELKNFKTDIHNLIICIKMIASFLIVFCLALLFKKKRFFIGTVLLILAYCVFDFLLLIWYFDFKNLDIYLIFDTIFIVLASGFTIMTLWDNKKISKLLLISISLIVICTISYCIFALINYYDCYVDLRKDGSLIVTRRFMNQMTNINNIIGLIMIISSILVFVYLIIRMYVENLFKVKALNIIIPCILFEIAIMVPIFLINQKYFELFKQYIG